MAEEKEKTVYQAMTAAMQRIGAIAKGGHNERQNFYFRGIDDIVPEVQKALIAEGINIIPKVLSAQGSTRTARSGEELSVVTVHVSYKIVGPDGSVDEAAMTGEAADAGDKAMSKAISMATKYFLFYTFWIPVAGHDTGDRDAYEYGARQQQQHTQKNQASSSHQATIARASAQTTGNAVSAADGITDKQLALIRIRAGLERTDAIPDWLLNDASEAVGRVVTSLTDLSKRQASALIDFLSSQPTTPPQNAGGNF